MPVAALPEETEQMQHGLKRKKNISKFNHSTLTVLITVHTTALQCYAAASLWDELKKRLVEV